MKTRHTKAWKRGNVGAIIDDRSEFISFHYKAAEVYIELRDIDACIELLDKARVAKELLDEDGEGWWK